MKIAVISDSHDNLANLAKAKTIIEQQKIKQVICLGDVQDPETWQMLDRWQVKMAAVMGNADREIISWKKLSASLQNITLFNSVGELSWQDKKIIFSHYPGIVKKIVERYPGKYALGLYGDTHQPWEENFHHTKLLNPGNIANIFYAPSLAIIDLNNLKAKLILLNEII